MLNPNTSNGRHLTCCLHIKQLIKTKFYALKFKLQLSLKQTLMFLLSNDNHEMYIFIYHPTMFIFNIIQ